MDNDDNSDYLHAGVPTGETAGAIAAMADTPPTAGAVEPRYLSHLTRKQIKYFWSEKPDRVRPSKDQLKAMALGIQAYVDCDQLNLYESLKCKMPGQDVEGDPELQLQYRYYLKKFGGYYADKNRANFVSLAADNAKRAQHRYEDYWCQIRMRHLTPDDDTFVPNDSSGDSDDGVVNDGSPSQGVVQPVAAAEVAFSDDDSELSSELQSQSQGDGLMLGDSESYDKVTYDKVSFSESSTEPSMQPSSITSNVVPLELTKHMEAAGSQLDSESLPTLTDEMTPIATSTQTQNQ